MIGYWADGFLAGVIPGPTSPRCLFFLVIAWVILGCQLCSLCGRSRPTPRPLLRLLPIFALGLTEVAVQRLTTFKVNVNVRFPSPGPRLISVMAVETGLTMSLFYRWA